MPVRSPTVRRQGAAFVALVLGALALGCASRAVLQQFPATSAASLAAPEARPARVNRALESDPPLPGMETEEWPGLMRGESVSHAHGGHHGH